MVLVAYKKSRLLSRRKRSKTIYNCWLFDLFLYSTSYSKSYEAVSWQIDRACCRSRFSPLIRSHKKLFAVLDESSFTVLYVSTMSISLRLSPRLGPWALPGPLHRNGLSAPTPPSPLFFVLFPVFQCPPGFRAPILPPKTPGVAWHIACTGSWIPSFTAG